ncbi:MAG: aminoacyl-tRNA hydrolase, partial [Ilumatobacteraceae bacterium]
MGLFGRPDQRRESVAFDALVVGLGNPGKQYARSRHNVGEEAVVEIARRHGGTLRAGRDSPMVDDVRIGTKRVVLAFPLTFMNESGHAVRKGM